MKTTDLVTRGVLRPDGTIHLDRVPDLQAGPVEVVLRPIQSSLLETLEQIDREQQASGFLLRPGAEINAEIAAQRAEEEERLWKIHSHTTSPLPG